MMGEKPAEPLELVSRDSCYLMMAFDTSVRPHEFLKLKIKYVEFKITPDGKHYAVIRVNGKTGSRILPLTDSIPYVKDWILQHPQRGNENAILICSAKKNKMVPRSLAKIFFLYKTEYFPRCPKNRDTRRR
jgi:integrase/recombinase XerD